MEVLCIDLKIKKFSYLFVELFNKIVWENRKFNDRGYDCLVSVDGVDFEVNEPYPYDRVWSKRWFSPKFKGPGVCYEICVCILTGDIVWVNGPFACGLWTDWKIFSEGGLKSCLEEGERVEADDGYEAGYPEFVKTKSGIFHGNHDIRNRVRARHETVNKRLKQFSALSSIFRHGVTKHAVVFDSVTVLTQISFNRGEKLFQTEEYFDV